jgi:hypothetical protein
MRIVLILAIVCTLSFLWWGADRTVRAVQFERNCKGYLKRAADSNTVALAEKNLARAVRYAKKKGYIESYTSILYTTPDEDVGFWYENLQAYLDELREVDSEATQLERSNVLMKLRETLLDEEDGSAGVTVPAGISVFPHNRDYSLWGSISIVLAVIFWIWWEKEGIYY